MRRSLIVVSVVLLVFVAVAGLAYVITGLGYVPDLARFQVTGVLDGGRTEYRPGEQINVKPFLTYTGRMKQVTITGSPHLFYVDVYTAENEKVLELPVRHKLWNIDILWGYTLTPNVPYNNKYRWGLRIHDYWRAYSFILEQPGSYKVVVRAEFFVGEDRTSMSTVRSEPIWITITG